MDTLIRLITSTIIRGTIYRVIFRGRKTPVIIAVAVVAGIVMVLTRP